MQFQVEVKQANGEVKSGTSGKTGKPYTLASQEVAVFVPGKDYPVVMQADVVVPDRGELAGKPQWYSPGMYVAELRVGTDRFGGPAISINFRGMRPMPAVVVKKVA